VKKSPKVVGSTPPSPDPIGLQRARGFALIPKTMLAGWHGYGPASLYLVNRAI